MSVFLWSQVTLDFVVSMFLFPEAKAGCWWRKVLQIPEGAMSCGVGDILPHLLVLGEPGSDVA